MLANTFEIKGVFQHRQTVVWINIKVLLHYLRRIITQPMMQLRPNRTELRLMDSFIQILCRFQKFKRKVPPLSPLFRRKKPCLLKVHVYGSKFFFSRNISFPSSKQKLFSFLHIGNKFFFSERSNFFLISPKKKHRLSD